MNMPSVANTQSTFLMSLIVRVVIATGFLSGVVAIVATAGWLPYSGSSLVDVVRQQDGSSGGFWSLDALAQQSGVTAICGRCGTVESTRTVVSYGEGEMLPGAGGAIGGLIGLQAGGGREVGMLFGALAGKTADKKKPPVTLSEVTVRLGDGSTMVIRDKQSAGWKNGDRVKVVNGALRRI